MARSRRKVADSIPQPLETEPNLHDVARHLVIPRGIVDTSFPEVEERLGELGVVFDRWQTGLGKLILSLDEDGLYACTVGGVLLSIPRQVAKTFIVSRLMFAMCTLYDGYTVLWTAHHSRTATGTFENLKAFADTPVARKYLDITSRSDGFRASHGEQEIRFRNGSIIMFGARERGFGRGFSEVDSEVFDEAQHMKASALENMVAATNQSQHVHGALIIYMGTPPRPMDEGETFTYRRRQCLNGETDDTLYVETSADPEVGQPDGPSLDDLEQVAMANPSYPKRTPLASIKRLRRQLPDDDGWRREGLGVWDPEEKEAKMGITPYEWDQRTDLDSQPAGMIVAGIDMTPDRRTVNIAIVAARDDGKHHGEIVEHRGGSRWVTKFCQDLMEGNEVVAFAIDMGSPAATLAEDLEAKGVPLHKLAVAEYARACGTLHDDVASGEFVHIGQELLAKAVEGSKAHSLGRGQWVWRPTGDTPISPLIALTNALAGFETLAAVDPAANVW